MIEKCFEKAIYDSYIAYIYDHIYICDHMNHKMIHMISCELHVMITVGIRPGLQSVLLKFC